MQVRVRFAPSPTGPFSLGNARTALFNWLFAQNEKGVFVLRIEDTDRERSQKKYENELLESLTWLGIGWDEGPIRQSERGGLYTELLEKLLDEKKAYRCFCTPEESEAERQAQLSQGLAPKYGGRCSALSDAEVKKHIAAGASFVIRFRMPEKNFSFRDLIRGEVQFDGGLIGDTIIAKSLSEPLYNFVAAVDDHDMRISHVIRGEDHLSNTPKQLAIQDAFGFPHPVYAHLPLILGPDRKKLSKRYLAKSVNDFRNEGFLPPAMLNFLALLGWHPEKDREVLSKDELINEFHLNRVQKSGALFNEEKLYWLNAHYLKTLGEERFLESLEPFLLPAWQNEKETLLKIIPLLQGRMKTLSEFPELARFFFELPEYPKELLRWRETPDPVLRANLESCEALLENTHPDAFSREAIEKQLMLLSEERGKGELLWPLRVALSGQNNSPSPFEIIGALGRNESLRRVRIALKKLES